jgi:hypothetical protein
MADITPEALETFGKLAPKSTFALIRKFVVLLGVLALPWFLIPWQYALAQARFMNNTEFDLFLHDLDRDSARWMNVASEVDVSSLKDFPYQKGHLTDSTKQNLRRSLMAMRQDIASLTTRVTLVGQIDLLMDLEEAKSLMADFVGNLDIENQADMDKFSKWLKEATTAFGEINSASLRFYGHMRELSLIIDHRIDVGKVR